MRVMIAVPCMDNVPTRFSEALGAMEKPPGTALCYKQNSLVYDARNLLSLTAIEGKYDYVLWIDSDVIVPRDALTQLLQDMQETEPYVQMISGLYVKKQIPTVPVIYNKVQPPEEVCGRMQRMISEYTDYPRKSLFEIAGCGFGCVLTSVALLKDVWDNCGPAFSPYPWAGEDLSFCWRVRSLKRYRIACDSRVSCGHIGQFEYTEALLGARGGEKHEKPADG